MINHDLSIFTTTIILINKPLTSSTSTSNISNVQSAGKCTSATQSLLPTISYVTQSIQEECQAPKHQVGKLWFMKSPWSQIRTQMCSTAWLGGSFIYQSPTSPGRKTSYRTASGFPSGSFSQVASKLCGHSSANIVIHNSAASKDFLDVTNQWKVALLNDMRVSEVIIPWGILGFHEHLAAWVA